MKCADSLNDNDPEATKKVSAPLSAEAAEEVSALLCMYHQYRSLAFRTVQLARLYRRSNMRM